MYGMTSSTIIDTSTPEALMQTFTACVASADLEALVDLYEPDAVFEPQPGVVVTGHTEIRAALAQLLALPNAIDAVMSMTGRMGVASTIPALARSHPMQAGQIFTSSWHRSPTSRSRCSPQHEHSVTRPPPVLRRPTCVDRCLRLR